MATWTYSSSNETNLMKIKYGALIDKQFNKSNVILGRVKKMEDLVGKQLDRPLIQSIGGGVGNGSLPTANSNKISKVILNSSKKLYAVVQVDRESMKRARTSEGAYVEATKFPVKIATESFNRNLTRQMLKGDINGSGILITVATGVGTHTTTKIFLDDVDTFDISVAEAIEIGDLIDFWDASAAAYTGQGIEVTDINIVQDADGYCGTGSYIEFASTLGATPAAGDLVYMQNSKNAELVGIKGVISATSGTYKNVAIGRRYKSYQKNASSASLSTDLLNELVVNIKRQSGESPDLLLMAHHQYVKLLNLLEDQKTYNLPARDKKFKGQISFAAVEFMSADGPIPCVPDRFMDADEIFALNTSHIELHCTQGGFEWFDEDGTVFLRDASADSYSARYGGYAELFVNPHFQGRLHSLAR